MRTRDCLIILLLCGPVLSPAAFAEPKHIEVYSLSQQYRDTHRGETLGGIVAQLLPNNMGMQYKLMSEIISLNPHAFEDNNPDRMHANVRLWLPNRFAHTDSKTDSRQTQVESFSWGNVKRPKR